MLRHRPSSRGFTLLEMMLSVAVFVLLVTAAFSLVGATTEMMTEVSDAQNSAATRMRLIETCRVAFESLTKDSSLEFEYRQRGNGQYDTYLIFVNAPDAFDFGLNTGEEIRRVVFASEIQPSGFIRSGIYYLDDLAYEDAKKNDFELFRLDLPFVELIPRMRQLSWRFYDPISRNWKQTLDGNIQTNLAEITFQIDAQTTPLRSVFWHPTGS